MLFAALWYSFDLAMTTHVFDVPFLWQWWRQTFQFLTSSELLHFPFEHTRHGSDAMTNIFWYTLRKRLCRMWGLSLWLRPELWHCLTVEINSRHAFAFWCCLPQKLLHHEVEQFLSRATQHLHASRRSPGSVCDGFLALPREATTLVYFFDVEHGYGSILVPVRRWSFALVGLPRT